MKIYKGFKNYQVGATTRKATELILAGTSVWLADAMDWNYAVIGDEKWVMIVEKIAREKGVESKANGDFVKSNGEYLPVQTSEIELEYPGVRPDVTADDHKERIGGRGYNYGGGLCVSNNSVAAREADCHPASYIDKMFKLPAGFTAWAFECKEWHDVSKKYNRVIHYHAPKVKKWLDENPETAARLIQMFKEWKKRQKSR